MGKRKDENLTAIRRALDRARELGLNEMDWLGTGSDSRHAAREERDYLAVIDAGIEALEDLHGSNAGVAGHPAPLTEDELHKLATKAGFGFFGKWKLYQGSSVELVALARAIEAHAHGVPVAPQPNVADLLDRFQRQAHRAGELWERCQGKGWPDAERTEFTAIRDERLPALRRAIEDACGMSVSHNKSKGPFDTDDLERRVE